MSAAHTKGIYYERAVNMYLFNKKIIFYFILVSILALNGCGGSGSDVINSIAAPQTSSPPPIIL